MFKKINPFFLIIALLSLVALSLLATDYLQKNSLDIFSGATGNNIPQEAFISNLHKDKVMLNWYTTNPTTGFVKIFAGTKEVASAFGTEEEFYHSIEVDDLEPGTDYSVVIISDGEEFRLGELNFTTPSSNQTSGSFPVYGQIFDSNLSQYIREGIVSIQLDNGEKSQIYSTSINTVGGYQFNLQDIKDEDLRGTFDRTSPGVAYITIYNIETGVVKKSIPYDFSKSRQLLNIFVDEESVDEIPGVDGQL